MINHKTFDLPGSNGRKIIGDISFNNNQAKHVALFVHGFKGFKDWGTHNRVAELFAQNDIAFAKFNFSHSGVDPENPVDINDLELFAANTPSKELYDLNLVIQHIKVEYPDASLSIIGHSRGGGLAILQAYADEKIGKLITWAAIDDFSSLWKKEQESAWRLKGKIEVFNARTKEYMPLNLELLEDVEQNKDKLNINQAAKNLERPWLIIHGNEDVNVDLQIGLNFKGLNKQAKLIEIDGANHVFGASHPYEKETLPPDLEKVCQASIHFILGNDIG